MPCLLHRSSTAAIKGISHSSWLDEPAAGHADVAEMQSNSQRSGCEALLRRASQWEIAGPPPLSPCLRRPSPSGADVAYLTSFANRPVA